MTLQTKSQCRRYGISKYEDIIEGYFNELGLPVKRHQVFCFLCLSMFTNPKIGEYPDQCDHCGNSYLRNKPEKFLYCMPDLVLEDPARRGKAVIFVNGKPHDKAAVIAKDRYQISMFKKYRWRVFVIDNEEIDHIENHVKHSNKHFFALGIWAAMNDLVMYYRAFIKEKEIAAMRPAPAISNQESGIGVKGGAIERTDPSDCDKLVTA